MPLLQASGRLTYLRVHDVGTGYGPQNDAIDVEAVIHLDTQDGKAFGFQLRNDSNQVARAAMLDVLDDAFRNNYWVTIDYDIQDGKKNGIVRRAWVTK